MTFPETPLRRRSLAPLSRRGPDLLPALLAPLLASCLNSPPPAAPWVALYPDTYDLRSPSVSAWRDAASEAGFVLEAAHDSDTLRPWSRRSKAPEVWLVPDTTHRDSPPVLLEALRARLREGASVLLSSDAFAKDYPEGALHSLCEARADMKFRYEADRFGARSSPVLVTREGAQGLDLPPGSLATPTDEQGRAAWGGYQAPAISLAHAPTSGQFPGLVLAESDAGQVLAGEVECGAGRVLFVNLPLTYLKNRTDGLWLHLALKRLGTRSLPSARLLPVPDGVGGLVFNFHIDSNAAIQPLLKLERRGMFKHGPFSLHVTAGPDAREIDDKLGYNVDGSAPSREIIKRLGALGHAVGSHGGWIHDYFGKRVTPAPSELFTSFLALNADSLERATGQPVREYSAPMGNHPAWVTDWLKQRGVRAYYSTGNVGLGPTRSYLDGRKVDIDTWSFPVSVHNSYASLEEMYDARESGAEVLEWLDSLTRFASRAREVRLIYSHPPGIEGYGAQTMEWLERAEKLRAAGRFRWYRMAELAEFLDRREAAQWTERAMTDAGPAGARAFEVVSAESLIGLTWCLPTARYEQPTVSSGVAAATASDDCWLVRAGEGRKLRFEARLRASTLAGR